MYKEPDFHFIAIGGVGQSALAKILLQLGFKVTGSDINESKYTKLLESLGAKIYLDHNKENIKGSPKIIVSSAIKEDNPELAEAKKRNLEIFHRSDCLKFISEKFPYFIGLSGTHGKTTTSGLLSFILKKLNANPAYAVGGIIPKLENNADASINSKYFIAELDESDGTIQKYSTDYLLINNLEVDHIDFYKNGIEDIFSIFKKTVSNMKENAKIFINIDNRNCAEFLKQIENREIITLSTKNDAENNADYMAKNINFDELNSSFDVYKKEKYLGKINLIIPGYHNIENALAIVAILDNLGFEFNTYNEFFKEFSGMGRRFQIVSDIKEKNIKIVDDYAHHPTEIKSVLNAVKNTKKRKVAIFQPHRYTRLKGLWDEFLNSFFDVDKLFVLDVFKAGDKEDKEYNSKNFTSAIEKIIKNKDVEYIEGNIQQAAEKIAPKIKENDLILTIGAGDITKIGGLLNDLLTK